VRNAVDDFGNLGGVLFAEAVDINNWPQAVGTSDVTGDFTNDGFLWQRGVMTDLVTVRGDGASTAEGINISARSSADPPTPPSIPGLRSGRTER